MIFDLQGMIPLKAEVALVILLGRFQFDDSIKLRIYHIIKNGVDWYEFLNSCVKTNLICIVYKNLIRLSLLDLLPAIIRNNMHYHYKSNCIRNKLLFAEASEMNKYFSKEKILVTPVKGIHLLDTVYREDPGLRILNDIDYLALRADHEKIHSYMEVQGFSTYLINDQDAFCAAHSTETSHFYVKPIKDEFCNDLRVDFDYSYSADFLREIGSDHLYEFFYLCNVYFMGMQNMKCPDSVEQFNFAKLIDIYAYCKMFLCDMSLSDIRAKATQKDYLLQVNYSFDCLGKIQMEI